MGKNVALIGLGPHSKRIYLNYFKKHAILPTILIELESNKKNVEDYMKNAGFTETIF